MENKKMFSYNCSKLNAVKYKLNTNLFFIKHYMVIEHKSYLFKTTTWLQWPHNDAKFYHRVF